MCRTWKGLILTTAALLGLAGCHKTEFIQPPKPKDEFTRPPADDPRFVNPPQYPNSLLNQDNLRKPDDGDDAQGGRGGPHMGGGAH